MEGQSQRGSVTVLGGVIGRRERDKGPIRGLPVPSVTSAGAIMLLFVQQRGQGQGPEASQPVQATYKLCDLGHGTSPLCSSASTSIK